MWHPVNTLQRDRSALPSGFLQFLKPFHERYTPWQLHLVRNRRQKLLAAHAGHLPSHGQVECNPATGDRPDWKCALPNWISDQRNQMTGPADDAELCVKMLNSGAPGVMLDLEDSMANCAAQLLRGHENAVKALHGRLTYEKNGKTIGIKNSQTITFVRVRGLHLNQWGVFDHGSVSASLFDTALLIYGLDPKELKHPPCIYIPKSESAAESFWWSALFKELAAARGLPKDWIKCMALVESHPLAFEMDEFIFGLRDHILGLNLGRWDYMASLIHYNLTEPDWVLPDRNAIPHDVAFFQNLREWMPEVCHRRGIFAIGGMTALYPNRADAELNERALKALEVDKANEAKAGMDGAWTGHPDQNAIAVAQFPVPNQLGFRQPEMQRPDLRPLPPFRRISEAGTRAAIRTVIRYRKGVLEGRGASLIDGYMEDLATDRIYRLMIAQRILHGEHTTEQVTHWFGEEARNLSAAEAEKLGDDAAHVYFSIPADISLKMILTGEHDPS